MSLARLRQLGPPAGRGRALEPVLGLPGSVSSPHGGATDRDAGNPPRILYKPAVELQESHESKRNEEDDDQGWYQRFRPHRSHGVLP